MLDPPHAYMTLYLAYFQQEVTRDHARRRPKIFARRRQQFRGKPTLLIYPGVLASSYHPERRQSLLHWEDEHNLHPVKPSLFKLYRQPSWTTHLERIFDHTPSNQRRPNHRDSEQWCSTSIGCKSRFRVLSLYPYGGSHSTCTARCSVLCQTLTR